jgi:acetamidase/formamidase
MPFAETADYWIPMGIDSNLNVAFETATRHTIDFLHQRAGLTRLDAYSLASIGVSFRVTQFVNRTRGVHAMIPKDLFSKERQASISVV